MNKGVVLAEWRRAAEDLENRDLENRVRSLFVIRRPAGAAPDEL